MAVSNEVDIANLALQRLGQPTITTMTEASRDASIVNQLYDQNRDYCLMLVDWDCLIHRVALARAGAYAIGSTTQTEPVVLVCGPMALEAGELVTIEDVVGMTELNGNTYRVGSANLTSVTLSLQNLDGTDVDGTGYSAWVSGGLVYYAPGGNWSYVYEAPSLCLKVLDVMDSEFTQDESYLWLHERSRIYTDMEDATVRYIRKMTDPSKYESDLVELIATRLSWLIAMRIHADKELRNGTYQEFLAIQARAKLTNATGSQGIEPSARRWTDAR